MKKFLLISLIFFAHTATADDVKNHEFLYGCLSRTYRVIGQEIESVRPYGGKVIFNNAGDQIEVTRIICGDRITGVGKIERALGTDKANVFRVRFTRNGQKYEITYLWQSDLDNYARLSGYVYEPGKHTSNPGLEALFIEHTNK